MLCQSLQHNRQRVLVNLKGERRWCLDMLALLPDIENSFCLSNLDDLPQAVPFSKADGLLGLEADVVIVDNFSGMNIDVLCMAAGLVRATGLLILLSPGESESTDDPYGRWQGISASHPYFGHYFDQAIAQGGMPLLVEHEDLPQIPQLTSSMLTSIEGGFSPEQLQVLAQLKSWASTGKEPLFLLSADRGRGKSTTLGMFAEYIADNHRVVVSAASRKQAVTLLQQLKRHAGKVKFLSPDEIIRRGERMPWLVIDEAAMIPHNLLQLCLSLADKTAMATTTGGYEGTGQGFMLKFVERLESSHYVHAKLRAPIRWGEQDILEHWINRVLMLKPRVPQVAVDISGLTIESVSRQQLFENTGLLTSVYGLLVSAHYRTRPSDLRQLMEDDNQQLVIARTEKSVVGAMLLNREGGFDQELSEQIFLGKRRPVGHLLAQMITAQAGIREFAVYKGLRVQRIAVLAQCRRQGIGGQLIGHATGILQDQNLDYLGSSFSIDSGVLNFWRQQGFSLVHIGVGKGKSSGRQTAAVLQSSDERILECMQLLAERFHQYLPLWLMTYCNTLVWQDVLALLKMLSINYALMTQDIREIDAFVHGHRGLDLTLGPLQKLVISNIDKTDRLNSQQIQLLIDKILLDRSWQDCIPRHSELGKKQLLSQLRTSLGLLNE